MTRWILPVAGGLAIVVLFLGWIALAPERFGGRAIYVTTAGASMEPDISEGDLVVLHKTADYEVGEIVAYNTGESIILHRIVDAEGDRFILQGDNNPVPDPIRPSVGEIRGELWIMVTPPWEWGPHEAGLLLAALVVLTVILLLISFTRDHIASSRPIQGLVGHSGGSESVERYARMLGPLGQVAVVVVAVLGIGSLLLAAVGFSRPIDRTEVRRLSYEQTGSFGYSAQTLGAVYDGGLATTGDPLYRDLVDSVTIDFRYSLRTEFPASADGNYRIDMIVSNAEGWSTTIPLVPERPFSDEQFEVTTIVDLLDLDLLIDAFEEQTNLAAGMEPAQYKMSIAPFVRVDGVVGDQRIREVFTPLLVFDINDRVLSLGAPEDDGDSSEPAVTDSRVTSFVSENESIPNEVAFLVGDLDVATARQIAIVGLALAVVLGTAVLLMIRTGLQAPESTQIQARYGTRIVDLRATNLRTAGRLVELAAFEDLAKIAEQRELNILHLQRKDRHYYFVQTMEVIYGYRALPRKQPDNAKQSLETERDDELPETS